jgi:hypothetical protein
MDYINLLGIISGVIGIFGFFYPKQWQKKWPIKAVLVLIIASLSTLIAVQNSRINRIEKISRSASILLNAHSTDYTSEGFIQAALSFMEKYKGDFPDAYKRATNIFERYDKSEYRGLRSTDTAYELAGLIKGIATLSSEDNL